MNNKRLLVFIIIILGIFSCLCLSCVVAGSGWIIYSQQASHHWNPFGLLPEPTQTPVILRPTQATTQESTPGKLENGEKDGNVSNLNYVVPIDTLITLEEAIVPVNDLIDLSKRLMGKDDIPIVLDPPPAPFRVGKEDVFWVTNTDTNESFQINATLRYVTDHAYFWVEDGVSYQEDELEQLAETFENKIYPKDREFFGSEWTPGVDGDPHLYILYVSDVGYSLAGYFSSSDEYPPMVHEYSNAHELFILNADNVDLDEEFTYGVLAHEFQHMIHWYNDRNEDTWLNEGFSELASFINGFDAGGFDFLYTLNPDIQLNDWPNDPNDTAPHYGGAFLFLTYFLDRFGEDTTKALVSNPENGLKSVDLVLKEKVGVDPYWGETADADDLFLDWATALYLQDNTVMDGRFVFHNYPSVPTIDYTDEIDDCPSGDLTRDVHQYGIDLIEVTCKGDYTLHFEGSTMVRVIPPDAHSGEYYFWSNKGDESDMMLTRSFDFRRKSGPITMEYWTWYDIEEDYDYVYVEVSRDGEHWDILTTPSGTGEDPSGNSFGWAYNGLSGGWIRETVDLSAYAGDKVQVRFEYVTDAAVNGEGFLLDDVRVDAVNYFSDFENDDGGWSADGFVRIQNVLPQTFGMVLIKNGDVVSVERIDVPPENLVDIPLHIGNEVDSVVLIMTGTTRYTRESATYRVKITP